MARHDGPPENMSRTSRFLPALLAVAALVLGALVPVGIASATALGGPAKTSLAGWSAGNIISDAVFTAESTMTEAQIQSFFDSKVKTCQSGYTCLKDFRISSVTRPADAYCKGYTGASRESAARIIYRVSRSCDINPQVLIVMLQKEQGLVTHTWPSSWRYDIALGQGCPDDAPCDPNYVGFFHQIYGAARQMQIYMEGKYFTWYAPGKTWNILYNPNKACGSAPVTIANKATAALYYYTPYQPNAAALRAGYGTGDSCSAYGNRNFYNYFTDWFGSTQKLAGACDLPSGVKTASRQYVTVDALNARKAPSTACGTDVFTLDAGTIVQARRVTADGDWIEVQTLQGNRWVARDYLRLADSAESECTVPAGTKALSRNYVARTATAAKIAPWSECTLRSSQITAGTVLKSSRVSGSGDWLQVYTSGGLRWVAVGALDVATSGDIAVACTQPTGTAAASQRYVVRSGTLARLSPFSSCTAGEQLSTGTVLQAKRVSASGDWLEVQTQRGLRWVARSTVELATSADIDAVCVDPAWSGASNRYLVRSDTIVWTSPFSKCGVGGRDVKTGTVVQATRISSTGNWLEIRTGGGPRWVARSAVVPCRVPTDTSPVSRRYIALKDARALITPLPGCGTEAKYFGAGTTPRNVQDGTVLQATRVSSTGAWLEVRTGLGPRWIPRGSVSVCDEPAGTRKASRQYVVKERTSAVVSPLAECGRDAEYWGSGTAPMKLAVGTVLQAVRVSYSGNWLQVKTSSGGLRWVWRADLRVR